MSNHTRITITGFLLLLIILSGLYAAEEDLAATRRFGIFIGSNNGGRDRVMLRYAVSDAKSISRLFTGMGGIAENDNVLLVEPTVKEINRQLDTFGRLSAQSKRNAQRTELVFYYSGHSDESGILLNRERYGYRELRERINAVQTDMRIVILDSCSSGAITRAKGGIKTQPFLFDSSVSTTGYAFLTSSSDTEVSQESDSIESSYFTHSLLAGLRGAADSVGDGRVTLNELYRFAYTETLARTETSLYGAQHPSYDIQISGSGDVVLTDIKEISASLLFAGELSGRISIRDSSDFLVAELSKIGNKPLELGLEPGAYRITLQQGNNFYQAEVTIAENQRATLDMGSFRMIAASSGNRNRGDGEDRETDDDTEPEVSDDEKAHPVSIQFVPGLDLLGNKKEATNHLLVGILMAKSHNLKGVGAAPLGLINTGYVEGVKASGFFNITGGEIRGVHGAGFFNIARSTVDGVLAAGFFNIAGGDIHGVQGAGFFNIARSTVDGTQAAGFFNIAGGEIRGVQGAGFFNIARGNVNGLQASGFFNVAGGEIKGVQAAGIVNVNRGGKGAMFGLINISRAEGDIVPFGLVNIIKGGILHPAIYLDEMLFTNFSLRSGSRLFYCVLSTGVGGKYSHNRTDETYLSARAGFGVEIPLQKFFIDIDVSNGGIFRTDFQVGGINATQLRFSAGYKIFEHLGVFAGISYDYLRKYDHKSPDPRDLGGLFAGGVQGKNAHKFGFFGGIQF